MAWDVEAVDGATVVTINTNKVNAQNEQFFAELNEALDAVEQPPPGR